MKIFTMYYIIELSRPSLKNTTLLPPQGFGPEANTRGGALEASACIHIRNFKNVKM